MNLNVKMKQRWTQDASCDDPLVPFKKFPNKDESFILTHMKGNGWKRKRGCRKEMRMLKAVWMQDPIELKKNMSAGIDEKCLKNISLKFSSTCDAVKTEETKLIRAQLECVERVFF
nr:hypothetical protein [Tanacetum cinerariifolium]